MKISVVIAAKNEERHIGACIESVRWADEVVVIDDCSTDRTAQICRELGARVIENDSRGSFHVNKNLGIENAQGAWILSLDADEIIPVALAAEIREAITRDDIAGYFLSRQNFFLGRWIKHCGWFPDYIIRLFRNGEARWPLEIHDVPRIDDAEKTAYLNTSMIHNSYETMDDFIRKFIQYSARLGDELWDNGTRINAVNFLICFFAKPAYWFVKKYIFQLGFLDGFRGLFICSASAMTIFLSHAILWDLQRQDRGSAEP